jgi:magnesium and cobalt exporter, CNNM family
MSTLEIIVWWAIVFVGLGGSALCSGLEVGLYTVNRVLVRVHAAGAQRGGGARLLESQIEQPAPTLTALLVWNNLFNYAGTLAITTLVATRGFGDIELILIQVVVLTPVLLIFAETTPKEVFRANADTLMERHARVVWLLGQALRWFPVVPVVLWLAGGAAKLVGVDSFGSLTSARERMAELLKYGSTQMSEAQASLIDRALELEHATVRSEMIPLKNAVVVRAGFSIAKAKAFVVNHPYSRFPVLSSRGHVVGVLNSIDLYITPNLESQKSISASGLVCDHAKVDGESSVRRALGELGRAGARMGIVRLGGRDVGIVTRKDLIEPLVGELEEW